MATVHFLDAIPVEAFRLYVACQLDDVEPREVAHTRMCAFDAPNDREWFHHDVEMNVVSVTTKINHANDSDTSRRLVGLSKEGEVDIFAAGDYVWRTEKIPNAGARLGTRGHMSHIRQVGSHLFACGQNGQVYQRLGDNKWVAIDADIYKAIDYTSGDPAALVDAMMNQRVLNCIDGTSQSDLYVVGNDGFMAHFDGKRWQQIKLKSNEHLQWVRCVSASEVWACGYNGTLLVGSENSGFKDVSTVDDNFTWWSLAKHDELVYLSATEGLFAYDGVKIKPVNTGLSPQHRDTYRVSAKDGALWSVGAKDIVRLFNGQWERFGHIDNPKLKR
jgi:hypothetical protein